MTNQGKAPSAGFKNPFLEMKAKIISGLEIPPLLLPNDMIETRDGKPRGVEPSHMSPSQMTPRWYGAGSMVLVQAHHANAQNDILDDIDNHIKGIHLIGSDKDCLKALDLIKKHKPNIPYHIAFDAPIASLHPKTYPDFDFFIPQKPSPSDLVIDELYDQITTFLSAPPSQNGFAIRPILKMDNHIFINIAKLRAAHYVMASCGHAHQSIHCAAPKPIKTPNNDPNNEGNKKEKEEEDWNHILTNVIACLSALSGGAGSLTLYPHSYHNPHAKRLARNIWLIAIHEAFINRVRDPAGGAHLVEHLTSHIAHQLWARLKEKQLVSGDMIQESQDPPQLKKIMSDEMIELETFYQPQPHLRMDEVSGEPPFTRGPYPSMYLTRPWTIRQYAGFSTAQESNAFYRHALSSGQKGLSVAFDLPTHRGYDSHQAHIADDVGMAGVAIDCLEDMQILFNHIPLDKVSVSMTMNGAVLPIMALYIAAAQSQNIAPNLLAGTIQNDILKEFMVRNTYIYPPQQSMRIVSDIFAYAAQNMPKFNVISISGYHMQEAGATKDLELAYTLADGLEYVRAGIDSGLEIDQFAPRLSFFWCIGMDFFMEIAKMRAARQLWAQLMTQQGAKQKKSLMLRAHCQTSGWSLTARDVLNNIARTCFEASAAVAGGTQSLHTNALDEALALPSAFSAKIARDTQIFLAERSDLCATIDGFGGSYYLEHLTHQLMKKARHHIDEIEAMGGMTKAIAQGLPKQRIEEAATRTQARIDSKQKLIIGVNQFHAKNEADIDILKVDNLAVLKKQIERLKKNQSQRDEGRVKSALSHIEDCAKGKDNLLEACIEAAKAQASVGEMSLAMENIFTRYQTQPIMVKNIYHKEAKDYPPLKKAKNIIADFIKRKGFAPRILIAKGGQDGHDRGQKIVSAAFCDIGFDVSIGALFQSPAQVARRAIDKDVHIVAISSLAGAHLSFARDLLKALDEADRGDIYVVLGGIIPKDDIKPLKHMGVKAVFPPGSDVSQSAIELLELMRGKN